MYSFKVMYSLKILSLFSLLISPFFLRAQSPAYPPPPPAAQPVNAMEWFIDTDPGTGNGTPLTVASSNDIANLTASIPLSGVPKGLHHLFIRSQDAAGHWSLTTAASFENLQPAYPPPAGAPAPISRLEVFFDNDPGIGNGSVQNLPAATDISNATLTLHIDTLAKGPHKLFVRTLDIASEAAVAVFANDGPLPLTWLYVTAATVNGQSQISWATAQESNTRDFEIEHSQDGRTFTTVGTIPAAGNSALPRYYKWIHTNPDPGINYYRIRQSDLDHAYSWSKIVSLYYGSGVSKTTALPNPVRDRFTILLAQPAEGTILTVYNAAGAAVVKLRLQDGTKQLDIESGGWSAGAYFVELQYRTYKEVLPVIKR